MKRYFLFAFFYFFLFTLSKNSNCVNFESPVPVDSRIKIFIYSPNEFFKIRFSLNFKSIIEFQKNEEIQLISIGDPVSWKLENIKNLLFINPTDSGVKTNMTIITSKRTYLFEIFASDAFEEDEDTAYIVKFYYPELNPDTPFKKTQKVGIPEALNPTEQQEQQPPEEFTVSETNNNNGLNFKYSYSGKDIDILPIKMFDNGLKTFLQFKEKEEIPEIFIVKRGKEFKVNLKKQGSYVVIDSTAEQFSIRNKNKLICIFNNKVIESLNKS